MHWQMLLWPFRTTPLILLGAYTMVAWAFTSWAALDFWVAAMVVTLGLPVWYAVLGSLSLYAEKLLSQTASGLFERPIDSETDVNPFQHSLAFRLFVCQLVVFAVLYNHGPGFTPVLLIPAALFPLLWLGVMLDESLFGGFAPRQLIALLSGLNVVYLAAAVLVSGSLGYLHYTLLYASTLPNILLSAVLFLEANLLFGALLYWRRSALNLHTHDSPEQRLAADLDARNRALDQLFHELHTHTSNGNFATAVIKLEAFMGDETESLDPLMHERLQHFQDRRLFLEHAVRYLGRLAARGEHRKAWTLLKACLAHDERFRPTSDETLLALTRAASREDVGLVNELLRDFPQAYPGSSLIPAAMFRRARVCIELLGDGTTGIHLLRDLQDHYPDFAATSEMRRYLGRLKPA
jgi:hypothetical protein